MGAALFCRHDPVDAVVSERTYLVLNPDIHRRFLDLNSNLTRDVLAGGQKGECIRLTLDIYEEPEVMQRPMELRGQEIVLVMQ